MTLESGRVLAARYVLLRRLGAGPAAEVWLARDRDSRADRVLKLLHDDPPAGPEARDRFLRGTALQREIVHPNVLRCLEVHDGGIAFAVFAEEAIGDLTGLRGGTMGRVLPALAGVAAALEALHARGLVHGDVKCANVLLAHDGRAMLTDFGLAARVGEQTTPRGGSPFTSSPAQLAGDAPAIADDVYGFGALAYELLGGYPPFYPDAAAASGASAPPALPPGRVGLPDGLERLVAQCLARDAQARPRNMGEVRRALQQMIADAPSAPDERPRASPGIDLRLPESAAPAIEPSWQRKATDGPSAHQLRSQGFRRGLLAAAFVVLAVVAGIVFFALPGWVERREAAARPAESAPAPKAAAAPGTPRPDLERLADLKRQVDDLRPVVVRRLDGLERRAAGSWAGEAFARGKQGLADSDAAVGRREYEAALDRLRAADRDLESVEKSVAPRLREALAAGGAALEAGDGAKARSQFELAARIDPANAAAKRGLARVATLDQVRGLLADAAELERTGQVAAAQAAYRKALQIDADTVAARAALARLESRASGDAFNAAVAEALAAASRKDYPAARAAYERAGRIRPGSAEVREGLEQVERAVGDRSIVAHLEAAQAAERDERWSAALAEYRQALKLDPNLLAGQQGVERAEPRAMLDAELDAYLGKPEKLFSSEVRGAARAALARGEAVPGPGPELARKLRELRQLLVAAETPVRVALASDNLTDVTIYRVGRLGTFDRKDMELLPGRYTVVGTRSGFRDVRREITVAPGREPPAVVVRCEEQI